MSFEDNFDKVGCFFTSNFFSEGNFVKVGVKFQDKTLSKFGANKISLF